MNELSGSITTCPELELELLELELLEPVELEPVDPVLPDPVLPEPVLAFPVPVLPVPVLPVPVLPVPVLPVEPPELAEVVPPVTVVLPAETVWPSERSVDTTVPPTGAVSVASARLVLASVRATSSAAMVAWSEVTVGGWPTLSAARDACAWLSWEVAEITWSWACRSD
jgi:hypothetical protein